ncbi:hypothetical protein, partial [uncultured Parabacteroides sp.]
NHHLWFNIKPVPLRSRVEAREQDSSNLQNNEFIPNDYRVSPKRPYPKRPTSGQWGFLLVGRMKDFGRLHLYKTTKPRG